MYDGVKVIKIAKSFKKGKGSQEVFRSLSFCVKPGEVLLLTGKNGSGKTTLLKIISGLLIPDKGEVLLNGLSPAAARKEIGYLGSEERALYLKLTGRQNIEFFAELYGIDNKTIWDRTEKLTQRLNMNSFIDLPVEDCSLGMKQRISIAKTLIHHPDICLFDEPLKGLDKAAKEIFKDILKLLLKNKKTVLIATHNPPDFQGVRYKVKELHP